MVYNDKQNTYIGTVQSVRHLISDTYIIIKIVKSSALLMTVTNSERLMITTRISTKLTLHVSLCSTDKRVS